MNDELKALVSHLTYRDLRDAEELLKQIEHNIKLFHRVTGVTLSVAPLSNPVEEDTNGKRSKQRASRADLGDN